MVLHSGIFPGGTGNGGGWSICGTGHVQGKYALYYCSGQFQIFSKHIHLFKG